MNNKDAILIFPHQLFKDSPLLNLDGDLYLVEEFLFFTHYKFHKQKIAFHRASMKAYADYLESKGKSVTYIEATSKHSDVRHLISELNENGITKLHIIDPTDNWLEKHIRSAAGDLTLEWYDNPLFINTKSELSGFFKPTKKKFFQTAFYKDQRKSRHILMEGDSPEGGKWTYDVDNRKKYPKDKVPPSIQFPTVSKYHSEAIEYVETNFNAHYGELSDFVTYPVDFESAEHWLEQFLTTRFHEFGIYEDAIVKEEHFLNHSLLSPLINVGLLDPMYVIQSAIEFGKNHNVPLNSTEGFVRQILGWREFIRGVYEAKGTEERTKNFWKFNRKIPSSFYDGSTGVQPIDDVIRKVLKSGYAHHIERLMILGNFM
ncbi:MAG: cryptochrome/photolyase family protein, partial [Psychroserpens sp.]|nr:cryptochrome/photolyase family protein [Psychroserpens sp.]